MNDKMNNPEKQNFKFNEILQHQSTCLYIKKKTKYLYKSSCLHGSFQFSSRKSSTKNTVILYNILIHVFLPSRTTDRFSKILDNKEGSGRYSPPPPQLSSPPNPPPLHLYNCTGSLITYRFVSWTSMENFLSLQYRFSNCFQLNT